MFSCYEHVVHALGAVLYNNLAVCLVSTREEGNLILDIYKSWGVAF